ncbi:hypothetical protein Tco_0337754 [Tanacetum coccineum]
MVVQNQSQLGEGGVTKGAKKPIGDTIAQIRFDEYTKPFNDTLLARRMKKLPVLQIRKYEVNVVEEEAHVMLLDKGKGILIEPAKLMKKKDLIRHDEEVALKLQAEFDEEERLAREKAEKEKEANIALIESWDDIQANINADYQLAERFDKAQESSKLSVEDKLDNSTTL